MGTLALSKHESNSAELYMMRVAGNARRSGLAKKLLDTDEELVRRTNLPSIKLTTNADMAPAIQFYKKN